MFTRLAQSWELTKQSWAVLRADKHLLLFPVFSGMAILVVLALVLVPAGVLMSAMGVFVHESQRPAGEVAFIETVQFKALCTGVLFVLYFGCFTVATFFNVALMACAMARFNGEDSSAKAGLGLAWKRLPQILAWSAVNATVGVILQMLKERAGFLGRWVLSLVGLAWTIATFFVVPVLVVEGVGPIDAVKRSAAVLKKTWGQSLAAQVGVSAALSIASIAVLLVLVGGGILAAIFVSGWLGGILIVLGILIMLALALVAATLKQIITAACYRFASTGLVPEQFDGQSLRSMFVAK